MMQLTEDLRAIGVIDRQIDLFEGQYPVPDGMAYNSYLVLDEKVTVFDTADVHFTDVWLSNLSKALEGRKPDYLVVQHMEPDHSAGIQAFFEHYPEAVLVGNARTFPLLEQFFGRSFDNRLVVADGDTLCTGRHTFTFLLAPMVHWPEVMMTFDSADHTFFSADAFGTFGPPDATRLWAQEARRYYIGIVGKYGPQVQTLLKKAAALDIRRICPLHGPVLEHDLPAYLGLYDTWSSYRPEAPGVTIAYTSIYGHTKQAALLLNDQLQAKGVSTAVYDLARCDMTLAVSDAFRYDRLVLCCPTYNSGLFPYMSTFLRHLTERGYRGRRVGLIENGSWAPVAAKLMKDAFAASKDIVFAEPAVRVKSALNEESRAQVAVLAEVLCSAQEG